MSNKLEYMIVIAIIAVLAGAVGKYALWIENRGEQRSSSGGKTGLALNGQNIGPETLESPPKSAPYAAVSQNDEKKAKSIVPQLETIGVGDTDNRSRSIMNTSETNSSETIGSAVDTSNPATKDSGLTVTQTVYVPAKEKRHAFRIPVLYYHSVANKPGYGTVIAPKKLEEQMAYLAKEGYRVLNMKDFIDIWEGHKEAPDKSVLITFDDGYTDNYTDAMPILKKYGFTAVLFMMPGWVGKEGYLNWEQIKEMRQAGWDIYPHSMTHTQLSTLSKQQQQIEIAESRKQIEEKLGSTADVFCYPYGSYNKNTIDILKENGFRFAFTIEQGPAEASQNPLLLKRLYINSQEDMNMFVKKLKQSK